MSEASFEIAESSDKNDMVLLTAFMGRKLLKIINLVMPFRNGLLA